MTSVTDGGGVVKAMALDREFALIVECHRSELQRFARRRLLDQSAAEDAVQETFLRAYRAFDRLSPDSHVRPWLYQILTNVCNDEARRRAREQDKLSRLQGDPQSTTAERSIDEQLGLDRDDAALVRALDGLPSTYQAALSLRYVDGYDYIEVGRRAGVTPQNARARVSRARQALGVALRIATVAMAALVFLWERTARAAAAAHRAISRLGAAVATTTQSVTSAAVSASGGADPTTSALPALAKAAIGVGLVATVAITASPEPARTPTAAAAEVPGATSQPIAADVTTPTDPPAPVPVTTPSSALTQPTTVPSTQAAAPAITEQPPPASNPDEPIQSSPPQDENTTPLAVTTIAVAPPPPIEEPAPEPTSAVETTAEPEPTSTTVVETTVVEAPPPGPLKLMAPSLALVPAGPRFDFNGSATVSIGGDGGSGTIHGRLALTDMGEDTWAVEGDFTIATATGAISGLLVGRGAGPSGDQPTSLTVSGSVMLDASDQAVSRDGHVSGRVEGGTLTLNITT